MRRPLIFVIFLILIIPTPKGFLREAVLVIPKIIQVIP